MKSASRATLLLLSLIGAACSPTTATQPPNDGGAIDGDQPGGPCSTTADCPGVLVCDRASKTCTQCRATGDCDNKSVCLGSVCQPATTCTSDLQCTESGQVCDTPRSRCVACKSASDCSAGQACIGSSCLPATRCDSSIDCASLKMICGVAIPPAYSAELGGKACQECGATNDCGPGESCNSGVCVKVCALAGRTCGALGTANCGTCSDGAVCTKSGTGCIKQVAKLTATPETIVADETYFYALSGRGATTTALDRFDRADGTRLPLASSRPYADSIAVNSGTVFWSEQAAIMSVPKAGGATRKIATIRDACLAIVADETYVYCRRRDFATGADAITRVAISNGVTKDLANGRADRPFVLSGDRVYFGDFNGRMTGYVSTDGASLVELATNVQPEVIAVDASSVFIGTAKGLFKTPNDGSTTSASELVATESSVPHVTTADGNVYYYVSGGGLFSVSPDGGTPKLLVAYGDIAPGLYGRFLLAAPPAIYFARSDGIYRFQPM